jgi:hypothetical protein
LTTLALANDWMVKELSLVAARGEPKAASPESSDPGGVHESISQRVAWLGTVLDQARKAASEGTRFGIFGSSIAAMWLYGELRDAVEFFVDEDPGRIGTLHGRPVLTPDRIPHDATVYFALIPRVANAVAARIGRTDLRLSVPPSLR